MMVYFMLIIVALVVASSFVFITMYVRVKQVWNGMLALWVKDYHEAVESLLKTPEDLPDGVLDAISTMNRTAFADGSHWRLRKLVMLDRKGLLQRRDKPHLELAKQIEGMRPELRSLFARANEAWLNIMCNRSIVVGALISIEIGKLQVARGVASSSVANKEAIKVLPDLCTAA